MIIKRIGPLSFAKLSAVLNAVMGLVVGGVFSLAGLAGGLPPRRRARQASARSLASPRSWSFRSSTA